MVDADDASFDEEWSAGVAGVDGSIGLYFVSFGAADDAFVEFEVFLSEWEADAGGWCALFDVAAGAEWECFAVAVTVYLEYGEISGGVDGDDGGFVSL